MAVFAYRAVMGNGSLETGMIDAESRQAALLQLRRAGARPIVLEQSSEAAVAARTKPSARTRAVAVALTGELAVLLNARLPLDRALALAIANIGEKAMAAPMADMLAEVREGVPLSQAMAKRPAFFPPVAVAMTEAGEANGELGNAIERLAAMLEQSEDLRKLVDTSMIYPISLAVLALGVILLMLLFVVPQFESLFAQAKGALPPASAMVLEASKFLRTRGWWLLAAILGVVLALRYLLSRQQARRALDRAVLQLPRIGDLLRSLETARYARTLGVLVDGNVALPNALMLAQKTVGNSHIASVLAKVAVGVREGGGIAAPLAAANVLPKMAIGFLRTGEETSQLGPMLGRLADVLDRDVRISLQRLIGMLTPVITIVLGASVASIIAAIMSAIIGFNELAISQ